MKKFKRTGSVDAGKIEAFNYRGWMTVTDPDTGEVEGAHEYFATLEGGEVVEINAEEAARLQNQAGNATPVGGYLIRYSDGWLGWSGAAAFEAGYTEERAKK